MFTFDFKNNNYKKIHFIGIGGISMSGIAKLLLNKGYQISGSDRNTSKEIQHLQQLGVKVYIGQRRENIKNPDLIIYTDAILPDNEELIRAKELNVPCVTRGQFLGALMRNYLHSIAISGSHGKSTTTSMISKILINSPFNPSILIGGNLDDIDGNVLCGSEDYLVTEACEFKANILHYYPSMAIILNIDADHLDFYKNIDHIVDTFIGYMKNLDENSKAIINIDDKNCLPLLEHIKGEAITFGMNNEKATYNITNISFDKVGHPCFDIENKKFGRHHFCLNIIGRHNIYNATAAIIATYETGIDVETIKKAIKEYRNLHRRMEVYGTIGDEKKAVILTDYGHHPREIKSCLSSIAEHKKGRLVCIFQPHTYSRTKLLLNDFAKCFDDCDEVIVTEIYAAREKYDPTIHSIDLVEKLNKNKINAIYLKTFEEARDYIFETFKDNDTIITTGCGNPHVLAKMIVDDYKDYKKNAKN